jgi:hypothetical protein
VAPRVTRTDRSSDDAQRDAGTGAPKSRSDPRRKYAPLLKACICTVSLVVALAVGELTVRLLPESVLGFTCRDGYFLPARQRERDTFRNSLGRHDVEHEVQKPAGVRRVLLLGDSYVAAGVVDVSEIPGQRLEHYLNAGAEQRYEVISLGKGDWGPQNELDIFQEVGRGFSPQIVVTLFLSFNDVENSSKALTLRAYEHRMQKRSARPGRTRVAAADMPFLVFRWSVLNQLLSYRLAYFYRDRTVAGIPPSYYVYAKDEDEDWRAAWRACEDLILQTEAAANAIGARYVVVAASTPHGVWGAEEGLRRLTAEYPGMKELEWDLDKPDKRIERLCQEHDIPFLALEPLFRIETVKGRRLHFPINGHWNPEGNDLAGKLMAEFLLNIEGATKPAGP